LIHGIQLSQLSSDIVPSSRISHGLSGQTVVSGDSLSLGLELRDMVGLTVARAVTGVAVGKEVALSVNVMVELGPELGEKLGLNIATGAKEGLAVEIDVGLSLRLELGEVERIAGATVRTVGLEDETEL
jgi:hypothetical protein